MNSLIHKPDSLDRSLLKRASRILLFAMIVLLMPFSAVHAQEDRGRADQRAAIREANRERWIQRQQEIREFNQQRDVPQWQRRNQLGIPQQFDPGQPGFPHEGGPDNWRDRRSLGRMTPEDRQALRRQIQEAGRSVYSAPPPGPPPPNR